MSGRDDAAWHARHSPDSLLIRSRDDGHASILAEVTAEQAGWEHLSMAVRRLGRGEVWRHDTGACEYVYVVLGGLCSFTAGSSEYRLVGQRADVFSGLPHALYVSGGVEVALVGESDQATIAICSAPTDERHPTQLITPADVGVELRGGGNASRQINSVIPPGFDCQRLVCVEVYTPGGNWSSFPPHKHDRHRQAADGTLIEADLEEIYYYRIDRAGGYACQRVYTPDGRIDDLLLAADNDIVLVPEGYHPVVSAHGYTTYYLNFLAGSAQSLANSFDPCHAWVMEYWEELDPRLPIVTLEQTAAAARAAGTAPRRV